MQYEKVLRVSVQNWAPHHVFEKASPMSFASAKNLLGVNRWPKGLAYADCEIVPENRGTWLLQTPQQILTSKESTARVFFDCLKVQGSRPGFFSAPVVVHSPKKEKVEISIKIKKK